MNLDDLMAVWRSQDASPLHGVNETLLRLALRQDETRLRTLRRRNNWLIYLLSAFVTAIMAIFIGMMFLHDDDVITGWDFVVPVVGGVAALLLGVALYMIRRGQVLREQRFGDSLRDQVGRRIAQLDDYMTRGFWLTMVLCIAMFVGGTAIAIAGRRVNMEPNEPFTGWLAIVGLTVYFAICAGASRRMHRRSIERHVLPQKQRLEGLLKEIEGQ